MAIAAAHLRRSRGANSGGLARRRFHRERMQKVPCWTVTSDVEGRPEPLHRTLLHVHDLGQSKSTLRQAGSKTVFGRSQGINCRPAGTAPKQSKQRRASSLSSTCRWPNGPDAPTTTFLHAQITAERAESIRPKGTKTGATHSRHSLLPAPLLLGRVSFKPEHHDRLRTRPAHCIWQIICKPPPPPIRHIG